jgi:RNA polymerase sigma-70 factor (ECF subfamily)
MNKQTGDQREPMLQAITSDTIIQAQKGDTGVISALYERYRLGVFRYLYYRTGDLQAAEDLTSEVFLRMLRSIENYQPTSVSFDAWLFQIARNVAIDHYRKSRHRRHLPLKDELVAKDEHVEGSVERQLISENLAAALAQLNEAQRDVIVMRFVVGMRISQVAHTLHKSEDAIKGLQRRGLKALRDILSDWEVNYA